MKVSKSTIIRTVILFLSLLNAVLEMLGVKTLPVEDETVAQVVSAVILIAGAVCAWWKNNSFSEKAIKADEFMKGLENTD